MQPSEIKAPPLPYSKAQDFFLDRFLKKSHIKGCSEHKKSSLFVPESFPKNNGRH